MATAAPQRFNRKAPGKRISCLACAAMATSLRAGGHCFASLGGLTMTPRSRLPLRGVAGEPEVSTAVPRLRPATAGDMPWIALTIASMVMSPFGLQAENFLVAEDDGPDDGRLGFAQLRRLGPSDSQGEEPAPFLLASLYVKAEARGQGVGSRLVRALLGRSDEPRKRTVYALTLKNKLGFFERLQFKELSGKDLSLLPTELGLRHLENLDSATEQLRAHHPHHPGEVSEDLVDVLREISASAETADADAKTLSCKQALMLQWAAAGAGGSVSATDAKLLLKKVHIKLARKLRSSGYATNRSFPEVCREMLTELESAKQAASSTCRLPVENADSAKKLLAKCFTNLLEASDLKLVGTSIIQLLPAMKAGVVSEKA
eukprot:s1083_g1.t1